MRNIRVLDVTLRDGGCVNDFNFGTKYMSLILKAQENAGIDVIELGYLDDVYGSDEGRTKFISEQSIYHNFLKEKKKDVTYVAMMDFGKFNVNALEHKNAQGIDGIRLAFHKKDYIEAINIGKEIISKGYKLYMQPMITMRYSDRELLDLVEIINVELPNIEALYIVDSFGEMRGPDLNRIWSIIDYNLNEDIKVGFHSHNNLQLSYSNAMEFIRISSRRDIYIDSSIMGMGKGAGNLNTELLIQHLIITMNAVYKVEPILEVMDRVINQLKGEFDWGYAPEYYLSAINGCSPTYASFFYDKHMLTIEAVNGLLKRIDENKKISFDKEYAEEIYRLYNVENIVDDKTTVKEIADSIAGKSVVLVAPGKSIIEKYNIIMGYISNKNDYFSIGLNVVDQFEFDYIMTTRKEIYEDIRLHDKNVIVTSNIDRVNKKNVRVINYANWIIQEDKTYDSAFVIALKLLEYCGVKQIVLAGFDGFSKDINANYYDESLRHPLKDKQVSEYNSFYKKLIEDYRDKGIKITFITESKYE